MDTPRADGPRRMGRQLLLLGVVVLATLLLLLGALWLARGSGGGPLGGDAPSSGPPATSAAPGTAGAGASGSQTPSSPPSATASVGPDGDPILIGAGDIGDCDTDGDEATAALLDGLPGTIFTAGDNVYPDGTLESFQACY